MATRLLQQLVKTNTEELNLKLRIWCLTVARGPSKSEVSVRIRISAQNDPLVKRLTRITFYDEAWVRTPYGLQLGISYNGYYDGFANHKLGFNSLYLHKNSLEVLMVTRRTVTAKIAGSIPVQTANIAVWCNW